MDRDIIRQLPDSVANQIAAGEVIQRPASVIKELVENSIDAGAKSIQIIIKDAGRTLIQVVDDGKGMSPTDARMAFERHATSKIVSADDLYTLHTMGFRGEALPSIASVAQVDMRTMRRGDTVGSRICISESKFESQEPASCVPGTNLMVKNLFFHMPARRKFLKKDSVEMSHILHEFERLALVNTNVEFTIIHNDITLHKLPAGSLKQRITALFGKSVGSNLVEIGTETPMVRISGFISAPKAARRRGASQFLFVNGRNMRHLMFQKAVAECYEPLIASDLQPHYFINFEVDPATIDVNVHPQKHTIKFENEFAIRQILVAAVRQALGRINAAGAIDFESEQIPDIPVFMPDNNAEMPGISTDEAYDPFATEVSTPPTGFKPNIERRSSVGSARAHAPTDWEKLYQGFVARRDEITPSEPSPEPTLQSPVLDLDTDGYSGAKSLLVAGKYIVMPSPNGMVLIDRRRAHIRVLFERYMKTLSDASLASQALIFPESVSFSPSQNAVMSAIAPIMPRLGFDVSFLGDGTWAVNAAPVLPGNANPSETLRRIVADVEDTGDVSSDALLRPAALAIARAAAVPSGREMSQEETDELVAAVFSSEQPDFTPDGLKIFVKMDIDDLVRMF